MTGILTPGQPQRFADGECRRMPPGAWLIRGVKARPEGDDELIVVTLRRCGSQNVVWLVVLQGRGPEVRHSFEIPVWSRGAGVEVLVQDGVAWIEVNAEKREEKEKAG